MVKNNYSYVNLLTGGGGSGGGSYANDMFGSPYNNDPCCIDFKKIEKNVVKIFETIVDPYLNSNSKAPSASLSYIEGCFKELERMLKKVNCQTISQLIVSLQVLLDIIQQVQTERVITLNYKNKYNTLKTRVDELERQLNSDIKQGIALDDTKGELTLNRGPPTLLILAMYDIYAAWYKFIHGDTNSYELRKLCDIRHYIDSLKTRSLGTFVELLEERYDEELWRFVPEFYRNWYLANK